MEAAATYHLFVEHEDGGVAFRSPSKPGITGVTEVSGQVFEGAGEDEPVEGAVVFAVEVGGDGLEVTTAADGTYKADMLQSGVEKVLLMDYTATGGILPSRRTRGA